MVNASQASSSSSSSSSESAFSFISKGWSADLQLMRERANSFKNLANSFDREIENFLSSAPTFSVPAAIKSPPAEIDFVKKFRPNLSEIRRAYSSPDFSRKVLEKWSPATKIKIDLSAIRDAIVSETDESMNLDRPRREKKLNFREFWGEWKASEEEDTAKDWVPIRALKTRLKELEKRSGGFKNSEFVEKFKSSLVCSFLVFFFYE